MIQTLVKSIAAFVLATIMSNAYSATAVASVDGSKIWGVGIKKTLIDAVHEAMSQCLEARGDLSTSDCLVIAKNESSSGGAIIEADEGMTIYITARSEKEAVDIAYQSCLTKFANCNPRAKISWYETGGLVLNAAEK